MRLLNDYCKIGNNNHETVSIRGWSGMAPQANLKDLAWYMLPQTAGFIRSILGFHRYGYFFS